MGSLFHAYHDGRGASERLAGKRRLDAGAPIIGNAVGCGDPWLSLKEQFQMSNTKRKTRAKLEKKTVRTNSKAKRTAPAPRRTTKPIKPGRKAALDKLKISGALEWLLPMMETAY